MDKENESHRLERARGNSLPKKDCPKWLQELFEDCPDGKLLGRPEFGPRWSTGWVGDDPKAVYRLPTNWPPEDPQEAVEDGPVVKVLRLPGDKVFLVSQTSVREGGTCEVCGGTGLVDDEDDGEVATYCPTCDGDGYLANVWTYGPKDCVIEEVLVSAKLVNGRLEVKEAYRTSKRVHFSSVKSTNVYSTEEEAQAVCDLRNGGVV